MSEPDVQPYGREYVEEEWPHGLTCLDCGKVLGEGDRYATRLIGFQDDVPITEVVCVECALKGS